MKTSPENVQGKLKINFWEVSRMFAFYIGAEHYWNVIAKVTQYPGICQVVQFPCDMEKCSYCI